jgi:hypothetical protein
MRTLVVLILWLIAWCAVLAYLAIWALKAP